MKRKNLFKFVLCLIFLFPYSLTAQPELFGYFESEMDGIKVSGQNYSFGYNKVRLDLKAYPSENLTAGANLNYHIYHGKTVWNLFDFLPERVWPDSINEYPFPIRDTLYLDNAFMKMRFRAFDLTIGKQQISLGTGYAWNPVDIFNMKELLDPTYEQTGVTALRLEVPLSVRGGLDLIVSHGEDWESSTKMIRTKWGLGTFDFTALYGELRWELVGFDSLVLNRRMISGSLVGEVAGIGVWFEGGHNFLNDDEDFDEFLVGLDHTFDFQTYFLCEYYHNGFGPSKKESLTIDNYLYLLGGSTHSLMQDYLFSYVNQPVTDLMDFGIFGICNLNDGSFVLNPQITYNIFENTDLSLVLSYFHGEDDSEFGLQDFGGRIRIRAYF
ncbi:hypothetical protein ISS37_09390 [candidate division KSB1 bacterium]|nr:hypothetical protein [candidate division KSB1 bacterium]